MQISLNVAGFLNPFTDEAITVSTVAIGLSADKLKPSDYSTLGLARVAVISIEGPVRYRLAGNTTSSTGHLLSTGDWITVSGQQMLSSIKFIRDASATGDVTIRVTYLR